MELKWPVACLEKELQPLQLKPDRAE